MRSYLVAAALALAACTACAPAPPTRPAQADGMTAAQAVAEYQQEEATLTLAPNWQWPSPVTFAAADPRGTPIVYQVGYGRTHADWYHFCSWGAALTAPHATPT